MSFQWNKGLPFLPGNTFRDVKKSAFHRPQTLHYKSGIASPQRPTVGIGNDPLLSEQLHQQEINELSIEQLNMTYGPSEKTVHEKFIPAYVTLDKKVLCFHAYFMEDILFSPVEKNRKRNVAIYYYLEDDSMSIIEPLVENSGITQGTRVKRHRLPKNERGEHFHWKDLNLGFDLKVYGIKYHIAQCDAFTKEFMEKEGIVLNDPEPMPEDPHSKSHKSPTTFHHSKFTPSNLVKRHRSFIMDEKVLRFSALWKNQYLNSGSEMSVVILYYLGDDTVAFREVRNKSRSDLPFMMQRQRIPKKLKSESFPSCMMEISKEDVVEYLSPKDFQLGQPIKIQGFCFLLNDCDDFTREYYQKNYPEMKFELPKKVEVIQEKEVLPSTGSGSLPTLLHPKPHEEDDILLAYLAKLDSPYPEDEERLFILYFYPFNGMIRISEKLENAGKSVFRNFLRKTRVAKPGSSEENPELYSPADFAIGATVEVFSHRFVLIGVEPYVLKYLESISSQIPRHTLDSVRQNLGVEVTKNLQAQ